MKIKSINLESGYSDDDGHKGVIRINLNLADKINYQLNLFEGDNAKQKLSTTIANIQEDLKNDADFPDISNLILPDLSFISGLGTLCFNSEYKDETIIEYKDNIPFIKYNKELITPLDDALALTGNQFIADIQNIVQPPAVKLAYQEMMDAQTSRI